MGVVFGSEMTGMAGIAIIAILVSFIGNIMMRRNFRKKYQGIDTFWRTTISWILVAVGTIVPFLGLLALLFWIPIQQKAPVMPYQQWGMPYQQNPYQQWPSPNPAQRAQDPMPQQFPAPQWTPQQLGLFSQWADAQAYMNIWTQQQLFWFQAWSHLFLTNNPAFQQSVNVFQSTDPIVYGQVLEFVKPTLLFAPVTSQWGPGAPIPRTNSSNPPAPTAQQSAPAAPAPADPTQQPTTGQINITKEEQANPPRFTAPN